MSSIIGKLQIDESLIIYEGGFYSLDNGNTISTDTIGSETEIESSYSGLVSIKLKNSNVVEAKYISVDNGDLTITGPGKIDLYNQNVAANYRIYGVRVGGNITINGSAVVKAIGFSDGVAAFRISTITVTENSYLYGESTGINTSITNAGKYGIYSGGNIFALDGGRIVGVAQMESYNSYGIHCDSSHSSNVAIQVSDNSEITGDGCIGIYTGGLNIVFGILTGNGGYYNISHGIQGDRGSLIAGPGAVVTGTCSGRAYAGILMISGYIVNCAEVTGKGGIYGVRSASSGSIFVTNGTITGTSNDDIDSYGVYILNSYLTANNSRVTGTGGRGGIYAGGDITSEDNSVVEGFTYTYGLDDKGYFGAVISQNGIITANDNSQVIQNYSRVEYYNDIFKIPYQNGKNMVSYLEYIWSISSGTGEVESDPNGEGIKAISSGIGILTSTRTGDISEEVVKLDVNSTHIINVPVELTVSDIPMFSVYYDENQATSGDVPIDYNNPYQENDTVTVLDNIGDLVRIGYIFIGWSLNSIGVPFYQPGDTFRMPDSDVTLYAVWILPPIKTYTVTYDKNYASNGNVPIDTNNPYTEGDIVTVLGNEGNLSKPGFVFGGWSWNSIGGPIYQPGNTFWMPSSDVILYAVWIPSPIQTYTVTYDKNCASKGNVPIDTNNPYAEGDIVTVLGNVGNLSKPGFVFGGWSWNSIGGPIYQSGDTFQMPDNDVILYAVWQADRCYCCCKCCCCKCCCCKCCCCKCCHKYCCECCC